MGQLDLGKSTIAREVAKEIGFYYLDSGMYYRSLTYFLLENHQKKIDTFEEFVKNKSTYDLLNQVDLKCEFSNSLENQIWLNEKNITNKIRSVEVTNNIKFIANDLIY